MKKIISCLIVFSLLILNFTSMALAETITRDNADIIIKVGEKYTLEAVLNYLIEKQLPLSVVVKWETSNAKIATVSKGIVTGIGEGGVIIKASASNNGILYVAEAKVYVESTVTGINLNKEYLDLYVGQAEKLVEKVTPDSALVKTVIWKSSNIKIATVLNGTIKGISQGNVDITVTTKDGGYTKVCHVTVISTVTGVTLSEHALTKKVGETTILKATVAPETAFLKDVKWISNNTKILTVKEDIVTILAAGTASVTAQTVDGNYKDVCVFTIENMVTGITLSKSEMVILKGNSEVIAVTINPSDAFEKGVIWKSDNVNCAKVDKDGLVTGVTVGETTIRAFTKDGNIEAVTYVKVVSNDIKVESIDIVDDEVTMNVGENRWFLYKTYPENAIVTTIKATQESVNGLYSRDIPIKNNIIFLEALGAGDFNLVLSIDGASDKCLVHIKSMVSGIEISKDNLEMYIGEKAQLTGRALPDSAIVKGVTWKSSNPKIAKVNETTGEVTGVALGNCILVASTIDGGLERNCNVVVKNPLSVESLKLRDANGNIIGEEPAIADNQVQIFITIDDKQLEMDQPPIMSNDRVLAPLRAVFEGLGAIVYWNEESQSVTGVLGQNVVQLIIGNEKANVNGETVILDVPAMIVNDRTLIPVRFISESLGVNVEWDEANNTVVIKTH